MLNRWYFVVLFVLHAITPALAQLPPGLPVSAENYALPHIWGSSSATNLEHYAMGGAYVADQAADWHGNPAGVLAVKQPEILAYAMSAGFDDLPTFHSSFFGYAQPMGERFALKISYVAVRAQGDLSGTPLNARIKEGAPGIELGYRASDRLWIGVSTAYLETESNYQLPGTGEVTRLESHPTNLGGRAGLIYRVTPRLSLGAKFDRYSETVEQSVPALGLPATSFRFDSNAYRVGLSWTPDENSKFSLDYEATQLEGAGTQLNQRFWLAGAQRQLNDFRLRIGTFDGKLTGGIGYQKRGWHLDYGFSGRSDKLLRGRGAHTAHAIQLIRSF
jgi:hypothetical protein